MLEEVPDHEVLELEAAARMPFCRVSHWIDPWFVKVSFTIAVKSLVSRFRGLVSFCGAPASEPWNRRARVTY
jgi:hypothetical protein